jgi:hypothetical protein
VEAPSLSDREEQGSVPWVRMERAKAVSALGPALELELAQLAGPAQAARLAGPAQAAACSRRVESPPSRPEAVGVEEVKRRS